MSKNKNEHYCSEEALIYGGNESFLPLHGVALDNLSGFASFSLPFFNTVLILIVC